MWNFLETWENIWKLKMVFEGGLKIKEELKKRIPEGNAVWTTVRTKRMDRGIRSSRFQEIKRSADHGGGKRHIHRFIEWPCLLANKCLNTRGSVAGQNTNKHNDKEKIR